jgi:DNA polymerase III subunit chi
VTKIFFFHSATDRVQLAVEWLASIFVERQGVVVFAPRREIADRLDRLLWQQPATGFLPHCAADSPLATETPILIANRLDVVAQTQRLVNLSDEIPAEFARFEELVEIVSNDDTDKLPARDRYRFYRERGYELHNRDVSGGL